jgi:trehalose synthase
VTIRPQEVEVAPFSYERFRDVLDDEAWHALERTVAHAQQILEGRVVRNVNSTAAGGGVAEMLRSFTAYGRGAGLDVRWSAIGGEPEFFRITKRIHNFVHGHPGDGGSLGPEERAVYERVTAANAEQLAAATRPGDAVILHDPQTAGLAERLKGTGALVLWRSHIGAEHPNALVESAWEFLAPYLTAADVCIFSRRAYVPAWAEGLRTDVIQPSIDAFSPKNQDLDEQSVRAILHHVGLVEGAQARGAVPTFTRHDGSPGRVDHMAEVLGTGPRPSFDTPLVVQVSRWDRLKDPMGVMIGFVEHVLDGRDVHLVLAGPTVNAVADDPEGAQVLDEVEAAWRKLPHTERSRVHLACLPMEDIEENAAIVNAIQRHATIVVQKSLEEGFGLTVAEGMWKARPVVASAVGGIRDQIVDGETGILLEDPRDLRAFGEATVELLADRERAQRIGQQAREHVRAHFLLNRHAAQYVELLSALMADSRQ